MFQSRPGARRIALLLSVAVTCCFFGKLYYDIRTDLKQSLEHAEQHSRGLASALHEHALRTFNSAEATIDSLSREIAASSPAGLPDEGRLQQLFAAHQSAQSVLATLFIAGPEGTLHAVSTEYPVRRVTIGDREYFRHHAASSDPALFISKPFRSRLDNQWLITATKRLSNPDGSLRLIVGVSLQAQYFSSFYGSLELLPNDRILLLRRDGTILSLGPFSEELMAKAPSVGKLFPAEVRLSTGAGTLAKVRAPLDGSERVISYRSSATYPIIAVIALDRQARLRQWAARTRRELASSALLLTLVGALALLINRQVARLKEANRQLSEQQQELFHAKKRSQEIVNSIDGIVWEFDLPARRFTFVSEQSEAITGLAAELWLSDPACWHDRVSPGDQTWLEWLDRDFDGLPDAASFEYRLQTAQGTWIWLRDLVSVVQENGKPARLRGVMLDVSQEKQAEAQLQEYRQAVEGSQDMVSVVDRDYRFLMANRAFLDYFGLKRHRLLGKTVAEVTGAARFAELKPFLDACLAGETLTFEQQTQALSGERRDLAISYAPVVQRGVVTRVACVARDETESKRAEQALRESEERYRRISNAVTDYIYTVAVAPDGRISTAHGAGCLAVTGYTEAEFHADGTLWLAMVPEEDRTLVRRHATDLLRHGKTESIEHRIVRKDGQLRWVRNTPVLRFDQAGRLTGYEGLIQDITERRNAEIALSLSEQRFRQLLENVQLLSLILDRKGRVTFCNDYLLRLTGWEPGEALGADWFENFLPPELRLKLRAAFEQGMQQGEIVSHQENEILTAQGELRTISWDNTVLHNPDGSAAGIACIGTDTTQQRALEEQLRQAQKMEATGLLAGGIAHDFNNILTVIIGYCSVLQMQLPATDPNRTSVDQVLAAAERAAGLTRSLLAFSRKQVMNPRQVDLNGIVRHVEHFLGRVIGEDITLKTRLAPEPLHVFADSGQIEQILMNLATNARDAMPEGGTLLVQTQAIDLEPGRLGFSWCSQGRYALLSIADTGMGMDEATRAKIFEPFFTTKEVGKGTGLGLAMAYGIVMQHNGQILVESEPGAGTTFKVYLPMTACQEPVLPAQEPVVEAQAGHELILVAEDETAVREMVRGVLVSFGYRVILAADGAEAVELFRENRDAVDLVLMDLIMPKMSGKAAYDEIQRLKPGTPTIFTSGYTADVIRSKGELAPETELVMKPVHPLHLISKVRELLDR